MRWGRRRVVCRDAVELMTAYMENTLGRADRRRFEHHLAGCPHCTEYLAQMRATVVLTARIAVTDMPPEVRDGFADLYRRWRDET